MTRSLRTALVVAAREQLAAAGHTGGQVEQLDARTFVPSCGCGYLGQVVGTEKGALDSLIRHLATEAELLSRNGSAGHAGNVR